MIENILIVTWILLSIGAANMAPMFAARLPGIRSWNTPLDFGMKLNKKPVFGKNKTWRGLLSGIVVAVIVIFAQQALLDYLGKNITVGTQSFTEYSAIILGALLGAGALLGDAVESFFKRRVNIAPGKSWFPFDQIDYILGAALLSYPILPLTAVQYALMLGIGFIFHLTATSIGYLLHIKEHII